LLACLHFYVYAKLLLVLCYCLFKSMMRRGGRKRKATQRLVEEVEQPNPGAACVVIDPAPPVVAEAEAAPARPSPALIAEVVAAVLQATKATLPQSTPEVATLLLRLLFSFPKIKIQMKISCLSGPQNHMRS
jgi:hypothetical protein